VALFPTSFVEDLRARADIVQVVQEYVSLKKAGTSYKGLCPFHGEKTPSFHVNREKGFFHCFGCGVGGDVIKFVEMQEKLGFTDAVRQLARKFGLTATRWTSATAKRC
jgi:DNA primase